MPQYSPLLSVWTSVLYLKPGIIAVSKLVLGAWSFWGRNLVLPSPHALPYTLLPPYGCPNLCMNRCIWHHMLPLTVNTMWAMLVNKKCRKLNNYNLQHTIVYSIKRLSNSLLQHWPCTTHTRICIYISSYNKETTEPVHITIGTHSHSQ